MQRVTILAAACGILVIATPAIASAADLTILVAPNDNPAAGAAAKLANGTTIVAEARLFKALDRASAHLATCGKCTVTVKVAGGVHTGKGGVGKWGLPTVEAPEARLHLLGGWDAAFVKRTPFANPAILAVTAERSGSVLGFGGSELAELQFSGFAIDGAPSNRYDKQTNSLLQDFSADGPMVTFYQVKTDRLVIADNIFINNAWTVSESHIHPASDASTMVVRNNYFLNNIRPWVVGQMYVKHSLASVTIEGNSFIVSWPSAPDTTTSNPGALEISSNAGRKVVIRRNLFAYNFGGAIFPVGDDKQGPPLAIHDNLFWMNGQMYDAKKPGDGAVVGKFNGSWRHQIYDAATVTDDFSWDTRGNITLDPKLGIPVLKLTAIGQASHAPADAEPTLADMFDEPADYTVENLDTGEFIENFAPRMPFDIAALPVPKNPKARGYGASASRVVCSACANLQLNMKAVKK